MSENVQVHGSIITTWVLMTITVCLRICARKSSKAGLWYDDWFIIPAMIFATAMFFLCVIWLGRIWTIQDVLTENDFLRLWRADFLCELFWIAALWAVKYSVLSSYWRLFGGARRSTRITIWVLTALVTCWGIAALLLTLLKCIPLSSDWDPFPSFDSCGLNDVSINLGSLIPHIISDIVLLGFSVHLIWKLRLDQTQKVVLTAIFAVGGLYVTYALIAIVVSIIRLVYRTKIYLGDYHGTFFVWSNIFIWTNVEVNVSLICACLPYLRPILTLISETFDRLRKHRTPHKKGSELLMDMLRGGKPNPPTLPLSRDGSLNEDLNPVLDASFVRELQTNYTREAELDAEAPGPHILEMESRGTELDANAPGPHILEMESRNTRAELKE